jgi:hypothetical protein
MHVVILTVTKGPPFGCGSRWKEQIKMSVVRRSYEFSDMQAFLAAFILAREGFLTRHAHARMAFGPSKNVGLACKNFKSSSPRPTRNRLVNSYSSMRNWDTFWDTLCAEGAPNTTLCSV